MSNQIPHEERVAKFYDALRRRDNFLFDTIPLSEIGSFPRSEQYPSMAWIQSDDPTVATFDDDGWLLEDARIMVAQFKASDEVQRAAHENVLAAFAEAGLRAEWDGELGEPIWLRRADEAPIVALPDDSAANLAAAAHLRGMTPAALMLDDETLSRLAGAGS